MRTASAFLTSALSRLLPRRAAPPSFAEFSAAWPWEDGESQAEAEAAWKRLSIRERRHAIGAIAPYLLARGGRPRKRPQAKTYLGDWLFARRPHSCDAASLQSCRIHHSTSSDATRQSRAVLAASAKARSLSCSISSTGELLSSARRRISWIANISSAAIRARWSAVISEGSSFVSVIDQVLAWMAGARPAPNANWRRPSAPEYGGLAPACYIPEIPALRAERDRRLLRRGIATLGEIVCIGVFLAAVAIWTALGAGA